MGRLFAGILGLAALAVGVDMGCGGESGVHATSGTATTTAGTGGGTGGATANSSSAAGGAGGSKPECSKGDDCPSKVCTNGKCLPPCKMATDCPMGLICDKGACLPCTSASQCATGQGCVNGACGQCMGNATCAGGQVCTNGTCGPCKMNSDCAMGQACINGACGACTQKSQCAAKEACINGACTACTKNADCGTDSYCVDGACDALTMGLGGHWKFDEATWVADCATGTMKDSSGNNNHALDCGGGPTASVPGKIGNAVALTGGQRVQIPASMLWSYKANDFSICFWAWLNTVGSRQPIWDQLPGNNQHVVIYHAPQGNFSGWGFWQRPAGFNGDQFSIFQNAVTTAPDTWNHVCVVRLGSAWDIYLNGTSVAKATNTLPVPDSGTPLVGRFEDPGGENFSGKLDDLRVYNVGLSAAQVKALAQ